LFYCELMRGTHDFPGMRAEMAAATRVVNVGAHDAVARVLGRTMAPGSD
jgi:hypothetical protein